MVQPEGAGGQGNCPACGVLVQVPGEPTGKASAIDFDSMFDDAVGPEATPERGTTLGVNVAQGDGVGTAAGGVALAPARPHDAPKSLNGACQYLVIDSRDTLAKWRRDGKGWMYKTSGGFIALRALSPSFPARGNYVLVEIGVGSVGDAMGIAHVHGWRLSEFGSLAKLQRGDDTILSASIGPAELNSQQKSRVREHVLSCFLPGMWNGLDEALA